MNPIPYFFWLQQKLKKSQLATFVLKNVSGLSQVFNKLSEEGFNKKK